MMADMADDDFYVDDDTSEEFEAAWRRGERGVTVGSRDVNQPAMAIVERAVSRLDDRPQRVPAVGRSVLHANKEFTVSFVDAGTNARLLPTHGEATSVGTRTEPPAVRATRADR